MPESARWMTARNGPAPAIRGALRRFAPAVDFNLYDSFTLSDERKVSTESSYDNAFARSVARFLKTMGELFWGTLAYITPIIWFTYFCSSFAIYLKSSFGVLFLTRLG